jgi:hypothetical protein
LLHSETAIDGTPSRKAFGRRRDGTGVDRVVAHVGAEVDAGDDHIRQFVEHPGDRQMHAVGRRAVDVIEAVGRALQGKGAIERQGVAGAAAIAFGRDDGDVGDLGKRARQPLDSRREVTVVVAGLKHRQGIQQPARRRPRRRGCPNTRQAAKPPNIIATCCVCSKRAAVARQGDSCPSWPGSVAAATRT